MLSHYSTNMYNPFNREKKTETTTIDKIEQVSPQLYQTLETQFYKNFDFLKLYTTPEEEGLMKFLPWVSIGLLAVNLILTIRK